MIPFEDKYRIKNLEMQAGEPGTFYGIYHVCVNDKDSIFQAFENFASRIIDE